MQKRATKYILNDYSSCYKQRLLRLELLPLMPLMYIYDLADIMFFVKSVKFPSDKFNIFDFVEFILDLQDQQDTNSDSIYTNSTMNSYFFRTPRLWNSLPIIDQTQSFQTIKFQLKNYFLSYFVNNSDSNNLCTFHFHCPCSRCLITTAPTNYYFL